MGSCTLNYHGSCEAEQVELRFLKIQAKVFKSKF